jgi:tetratricopeptide (TPR) repeat protein
LDLTFTDTHVSLGAQSRRLEDPAELEALARRWPATSAADLLALGRDVYAWLDGPGRWLSEPLDGLVLRAPAGSPAWRVPWELLADGDGHLARRQFPVIRRLREPGAPRSRPPDLRLGVLFMAAAPEGAVPLRFEDEEAAIARAVREPGVAVGLTDPTALPATHLDLFGEDTGNLLELAARLDVLSELHLDVLHLSSHGTAGPPPALSLEDEAGRADIVPVKRLADELRVHLPKLGLVVVSACETAAHGPAESLAEELVRRGAPAALAWAGKVLDTDATAFAAWLYHHLARGHRLDEAVAEATAKLLSQGRAGWALARLVVGSSDGDRLARAQGRRRPLNPLRDLPTLQASGRARPVCSEQAFVGRRRVLQRASAALRNDQLRGVVLTGIGQQGKSSLAVRLADRLRPTHRPFLAWGKLDALTLRAGLAKALSGADDDAPTDHAAAPARLRRDLEGWLTADEHPALVILDDFEQNLEGGQAPARVTAEAWPTVAAVLGAFAACPGTRSKLVITSRVTFELADGSGRKLHEALEVIPVPELTDTERARLRAPNEIKAPLRRRCEAAGRGNPGLTEALLRLAAADPREAHKVCDRLDAATPDACHSDVHEVWQNIAVDALLAVAHGQQGADLALKATQLFELPVPPSALDHVIGALGAPAPAKARERLMALGLIEQPGPDRVALNSLARARLPQLDAPEVAALAPFALEALRNAPLDDVGIAIQAFLLAAPLDDLDVLARTTDTAVPWLPHLGDPKRTSPLAVAACRALVGANRRPETWTLLRAVDAGSSADDHADDLLLVAGDGVDDDPHTAASLKLRQGRALVRTGRPDEALKALAAAAAVFAEIGDEASHATTLGETARILVSKGDVDQALKLHHEEFAVYERLGDASARAVTLGDIARILVAKGDVDQALKLHHEMLAVFERLGDASARAVTLGDIARILASKGDVDQALKLHHERLAVFERLGDARERAVTLGDIARILVAKGDVDQALKLHHERLAVFERLGDASARAVTLGDIARILVAKGDVDQALKLHHEMLAVFERLGDASARAVTLGDIARILASKGDVDQALKLHHEMLAVFERLGDASARAVTLGDIARILASKGDVDQALKLHHEEFAVYERLGDASARAVTLGDIARILVAKGDVDQALKLHHERLAVFERLGDASARAVTLGDIARILASKGDVDQALKLHHERLAVFERLGDARERAVTLGDIARILVAKGDVDQALKLHHERLAVFERLGDASARAVTLGDIARILVAKGDVDQALKLHRERLEACRQLGDVDGIASTQFDLGTLAINRGDLADALARLTESWELLLRTGRLNGIAAVGATFGQVLAATGQTTEAHHVITQSRDAFERLGNLDAVVQLSALLASLNDPLAAALAQAQAGDLDAALQTCEPVLDDPDPGRQANARALRLHIHRARQDRDALTAEADALRGLLPLLPPDHAAQAQALLASVNDPLAAALAQAKAGDLDAALQTCEPAGVDLSLSTRPPGSTELVGQRRPRHRSPKGWPCSSSWMTAFSLSNSHWFGRRWMRQRPRCSTSCSGARSTDCRLNGRRKSWRWSAGLARP